MSLKAISCACSERPEVWMWYFSFWLRSLARSVLHGLGPDAAGHAADDASTRHPAVAEEERQVGREVVDVHAPGQVVLHVGEAVGECEGQLGDGVRAGLGDVVAADRDGVEVPHAVVDEVLLDVAHHPQGELGGEDAGVLGLVLLEDVGLHRSAHRAQGLGLDALVDVLGQDLVAGEPEEHRGPGRRCPRGGRPDSAAARARGPVVEGSKRRLDVGLRPFSTMCCSHAGRWRRS